MPCDTLESLMVSSPAWSVKSSEDAAAFPFSFDFCGAPNGNQAEIYILDQNGVSWLESNGALARIVGDRTYELGSGTTSGYGRYVKSREGAPSREMEFASKGRYEPGRESTTVIAWTSQISLT